MLLKKKVFNLVLKNSSRVQYSAENLEMTIMRNGVFWAENEQLRKIILVMPLHFPSFLPFFSPSLPLYPFFLCSVFLFSSSFFFSSSNVGNQIFKGFHRGFTFSVYLHYLLPAKKNAFNLHLLWNIFETWDSLLSLEEKKKNNGYKFCWNVVWKQFWNICRFFHCYFLTSPEQNGN